MDLQDLKEKLVAVLGFGQEGKAVAAYLIKHGIKPVLFDQKPWENWSEIEKLEIKKLGVNFIFGPDCFKELAGFDVAFRSPGIKINNVNLAGFQKKGLKITSQTKWFFEHCPCKIIGVTGTKGKGTTASLIYEILVGAGLARPLSGNGRLKPAPTKQSIYLTGNIGKIQPLDILDDLKSDDWVVYELSSFQLQDLGKSPHIGVVLMVTSEHLDYHRDQQEYIAAKSAITKFQTPDGFAVINADFENSVKIGEMGKGKKIYFSRKKEVHEGCFVKDGKIVIAGSNIQYPISNLQLRGVHNLENVCAAISVGKILNIDDSIIFRAVTGFKGLEHRLEFVAEKQGIKFYNDSFSTTPETAIAAINAFEEPEIIILGGSSKNSDFTNLGSVIEGKKNIKAIILIGQEAPKIKQAIKNYRGLLLEGAESMEQISDQIKTVAKKGDVVLLSPACASFVMFANYKDRGEQFKNFVKSF